jgi:glycosyltransferase involved in cell wall biosynthesis
MISVALAAYNGSAYLNEQIESILEQLYVDDQMVISVDPSTDGTLELARSFAAKNPCITVLEGPGQGAAKNFEQVIAACEGTRIFLSDQDKPWHPHKVAAVLNAFATSSAELILHGAQGASPQQNSAPTPYRGCCMAFKRSLKHAILPFPAQTPRYDEWIGLMAEKNGGVFFLDEPLIRYRRHNA